MNDWNPNKEDVLYFHLCNGHYVKRNSYFKVDTINQRVYCLHLQPPSENKGRAYCKGLYELKWSTWISGYTHYLKYDYRKLQGVYSQLSIWIYDPALRVMLNRTSENQFLKAISRYLKTIL